MKTIVVEKKIVLDTGDDFFFFKHYLMFFYTRYVDNHTFRILNLWCLPFEIPDPLQRSNLVNISYLVV